MHIQEYNTTYTSGNQFLGFDIDYNSLDYTQYDNSTKFEWNIEYYGGGDFIISLGDYYLWSFGTDVSTTGTFSENYCLWRIINLGNYYHLVPKTAISGEIYSVVLGIDNNTPQLVQSTDSTGSWRIIRSHYYYNYDMTIYASEDYLHDELYSSHADVFDYACSSLYVKGLDNQKLIFNLGIPQYDQDAISDLICKSRLFILRAHGSPSSFCLNARDANKVYIGTEVNYNISSIESMGSTALSNLYCALYFSCHSAEGAYNNSSSTNFVKAVINKGAKSAIGFDGEVDCRKVTSFSSNFFTYLANNNGSLDVLAKDAFNATLVVTGDYYGENYSPYFYNGYVEIKID